MDLRTSRSRERSFQEIHDKLKTQLSPQDIQILTKVVPGLKEVMDYYTKTPTAGTDSDTLVDHGQEAKHHFHFVFRLFMRIISDYFAPLVIMLDDVQWSDPSSLELMQAVMTDPANPSLLMIGLYRSNEVEANGFESHLLTTVLQDLRSTDTLTMTEIEVGNLSQNAVHSIVMDLLPTGNDCAKVEELAALCHRRTQGNAFFLISFLSMLEEEGLLDYNIELGHFTWDIVHIKSQTAATSNIVELMKQKMTKLPQEMRRVLSMAACLGTSFDESRLKVVWCQLGSDDVNSIESLQKQLSVAVKEGFLEISDTASAKYRFVHDKVQESAFLLIPEGDTDGFKFKIGNILLEQMSEEERVNNIFLLANLLNETPHSAPLSASQQVQLAELNLQATQEALACTAFSSAATFAEKGISHLPADGWRSHYKLLLDLYSSAAEAHEITGEYDSMKNYCDEVLAQDCPILDKVRVYSSISSQISNSGRHVEAVDLLLEVLGLLGISFPKSSAGQLFATLTGLIKCKMSVKSRTAKEAAALPIMENPREIEIMKLLEKLMGYSYMTKSNITALAILKIMDLSLSRGVSPVSSPAFAGTATILSGTLNDIQAGAKMADYSLKLEAKLNSGVSLARTKFIASSFAYVWTMPWQGVAKLMLESYADGMASGDTER